MPFSEAINETLFPKYITWKTELGNFENLTNYLSKKKTERIEKSFRLLATTNYRFELNEINPTYLEQFFVIYQTAIATKKHGVVFDIPNRIKEKMTQGRKYQAISLWNNKELIGGLIYSFREQSLNVAFRIFPHTLSIKLPIAPSYLAEKYLFAQAIQHKKSTIIHGRDRNPYGQNSGIGVAEFKLSLGLKPYVSPTPPNQYESWRQPDQSPEDLLIFLGSYPDQQIQEAILITENPSEITKKYGGLFKQQLVKITTHSFARISR